MRCFPGACVQTSLRVSWILLIRSSQHPSALRGERLRMILHCSSLSDLQQGLSQREKAFSSCLPWAYGAMHQAKELK